MFKNIWILNWAPSGSSNTVSFHLRTYNKLKFIPPVWVWCNSHTKIWRCKKTWYFPNSERALLKVAVCSSSLVTFMRSEWNAHPPIVPGNLLMLLSTCNSCSLLSFVRVILSCCSLQWLQIKAVIKQQTKVNDFVFLFTAYRKYDINYKSIFQCLVKIGVLIYTVCMIREHIH